MCVMLSRALKEAINQRDRNRLDGGSRHMFVVATKEIMLDLYILYLHQWVTTTDTPEAKLESFPQIQNWGQLEKTKEKRSAWERWTAARRQTNHTVAPQNKFRWKWVGFLRAEKYQKKTDTHAKQSRINTTWVFQLMGTLSHVNILTASPFSCWPFLLITATVKRSAIKHRPAGDKHPSHLAGAAPHVKSPPCKPASYGFIAPHIPFISVCFPASVR